MAVAVTVAVAVAVSTSWAQLVQLSHRGSTWRGPKQAHSDSTPTPAPASHRPVDRSSPSDKSGQSSPLFPLSTSHLPSSLLSQPMPRLSTPARQLRPHSISPRVSSLLSPPDDDERLRISRRTTLVCCQPPPARLVVRAGPALHRSLSFLDFVARSKRTQSRLSPRAVHPLISLLRTARQAPVDTCFSHPAHCFISSPARSPPRAREPLRGPARLCCPIRPLATGPTSAYIVPTMECIRYLYKGPWVKGPAKQASSPGAGRTRRLTTTASRFDSA